MIYELIRASIETKLNNNTTNKKFVVGSYAKIDDKDEHFVYNVRNGYKLISTEFITAMAEVDIEYQAIPSQINGNATVTLSFLLNGEIPTEIEDDLSVLNEVIAKIVGNSEDLVGDSTYHTVWNCSGIIPNGLTSPINGKYYTQVSMNIYVDFSDTNYFGNRYTYFLGTVTPTVEAPLTQILPYDGAKSRENDENYPHKITEAEAKGGVEESFWRCQMAVYVNSFIETNFIDALSSDTYDLTKTFYYREKSNDVTKHSFWVAIKNITAPILLGEKQYISFEMIKSDQVIT